MSLINITVEGDPGDLFKPIEYPVLPAGKHLFVVANDLEVTTSDKGNQVIKCEFRCQDEDANKGMVVFENFVFIQDIQTEGQKKSLQINQGRFAQFTVACGVATEDQVKAGEDFDLADFKDAHFNAVTVIKNEDSQELDASGKPKKVPRASVKQFLYEPAGDDATEAPTS